MRPPLEEPVVGYRVWLPRGDELCGVTGEAWPVGDQAARCLEVDEHVAPEGDCRCGLYVVHRKPVRVPAGSVLGAVVVWGKLEVHMDGLRAAHARPVALARVGTAAPASLQRLSARYEVPLVELDQLDGVAHEFGKPVPPGSRPLEKGLLFGALADALWRRERCIPASTLVEAGHDAFSDRALWMLERDGVPNGLVPLLFHAWSVDLDPVPNRPSVALSRLRTALSGSLMEGGRPPEKADIPHLLRALDAVHGRLCATIARVASARGADAIPDEYLLRPEVADGVGDAARERARQKLKGGAAGPLPFIGGDEALLLLEPELSDEELESFLLRMRSSANVARLLEQARERRPHLARAVLRHPGGLGAAAAAEPLGLGARPLLLRQLHRSPFQFSLSRSPSVAATVGLNELRLAAERAMRLATDATDVVQALALLPGDEARVGLGQLVSRLDRVDLRAENQLRVRAWRLICLSERLVRLLSLDRVRAALCDDSLDVVDHVLLLRTHPDSDHTRAAQMWEEADLRPRFALDVLRATGQAQLRLASEALRRGSEARRDSAQAARTAAGVVIAAEGNQSLDAITALAADASLPATVRAVASFVTRTDPHGDDFAERYHRWLERRPGGGPGDPLISLLSGAWLRAVV